MRQITVRVPATTANCGPGFDVLGLALKLYSTFHFSPHESLSLAGCDAALANTNNLIYRAFARVFEAVGKPTPGVHIAMTCQVPIARGLGSSSTCVVAGALAANAWLGHPLTMDEVFAITTEMEGHPDNVAPALFGALHASFQAQDALVRVRYALDPRWRFVVLIPPYEVKTSEARARLPKSYPMGAVTHSVGHALAVTKALETGDETLLRLAHSDVIHEPYRAPLIADYEEAKAIAHAKGACAFLISGSGSTLLALTTQEAVADELLKAYQARFVGYGAHVLEADNEGARVSVSGLG